MDQIDDVLALAALVPAGWLLWLAIRMVSSSAERRAYRLLLTHDPLLAVLMTLFTASVVAFLLWVGTLGRVFNAWTAAAMFGFGLAALIWHEAYSRKRPSPERR